MTSFAADPHWGGWIVAYFFLGGIAAGAYCQAALVELVGGKEDRALARSASYLAFPLICVCGVLLIVDLDSPARFWHMLLAADTGRPTIKLASPMSVGAWAILVFSLASAISFLGALADGNHWGFGRFSRVTGWLHGSARGKALHVVGAAVGFYVASYTGALLTATNQPVWSDSPLIAPLFLVSAASTGAAATMLAARLGGRVSDESLARLARMDGLVLPLELATLAVYLVSLEARGRGILTHSAGLVLVFVTGVLGLAVPLAMHHRAHVSGRKASVLAALLVLAGGLAMRQAILSAPGEFLAARP